MFLYEFYFPEVSRSFNRLLHRLYINIRCRLLNLVHLKVIIMDTKVTNMCSGGGVGGGGWSKGLIGHISQGLREKVKCQTECCIFLMGHVKPGLFEL